MLRSLLIRVLLLVGMMSLSLGLIIAPAEAAGDPYIARYLKVTEPIPLTLDERGQSRTFAPEDLAKGKRLFEENCMNCHVGGATLPDPTVPLSLEALKGATPARDNIQNLVAYFRHPMTYDGTEETFWCREVPETWLSQVQVENLAAFILRAAETAPGWGTNQL